MKLSEKGTFAPPPRLPAASDKVATTLACWEGVLARAHWLLGDETQIDGADFYFGDDELGHIHLDGEAHVVLPPAVADRVIAAGGGRRFPWSRSIVVFPIVKASDRAHALWLFDLSLQRRKGASLAALHAIVEGFSSAGAAASASR